MAGAAAAMGRAVDKLKDLNTRLAVPPELEALDHLLKAQKDLDKREISRQQVGTGAGNNRSSQDLSSLFDQELQRQQQTNYETPKSTEEKKPDRNAEMLEKIKDLSARQDELAQRQRDLAQARQKMSPQELTRELQKLTREQNDLRQRAEDLAKQLSQPNRGDQKSDSSQQNQPGQQQAGGQQQGGQQQARRPRPYNQVITDRAVTDAGGITVHRVDDRWFFEIPDSLIRRDFLLVSRIAGVPASIGGFLSAGTSVADDSTVAGGRTPGISRNKSSTTSRTGARSSLAPVPAAAASRTSPWRRK